MNTFLKNNAVTIILSLVSALFCVGTLLYNAGGKSAELTQVREDVHEIKTDVKDLQREVATLTGKDSHVASR